LRRRLKRFSIKELASKDKAPAFKRRIVISSLFFIAGFSVIFIGMGATATTFGKLISSHIIVLRRIAGVVIVIFGLHIAGWLRLSFRCRNFNKFPWTILTTTYVDEKLIKGEQALLASLAASPVESR